MCVYGHPCIDVCVCVSCVVGCLEVCVCLCVCVCVLVCMFVCVRMRVCAIAEEHRTNESYFLAAARSF